MFTSVKKLLSPTEHANITPPKVTSTPIGDDKKSSEVKRTKRKAIESTGESPMDKQCKTEMVQKSSLGTERVREKE